MFLLSRKSVFLLSSLHSAFSLLACFNMCKWMEACMPTIKCGSYEQHLIFQIWQWFVMSGVQTLFYPVSSVYLHYSINIDQYSNIFGIWIYLSHKSRNLHSFNFIFEKVKYCASWKSFGQSLVHSYSKFWKSLGIVISKTGNWGVFLLWRYMEKEQYKLAEIKRI